MLRVAFHWLFFSFLAASLAITLLFKAIPPPVTPLMVLRNLDARPDGSRPGIHKTWVSLKDQSPLMIHAVLAAEDNHFATHWGFEWGAIRDALRHNQKARVIRGASTISQQTAKNVFLWPARSWVRKGLEAWFTMLVEVFWGKARIMEVYLNVVEMGDGLYGTGQAAKVYFGKEAPNLSRQEAALLAGILPGPLLWNPNKPSPRMYNRQKIVLRNMKHLEKVWF